MAKKKTAAKKTVQRERTRIASFEPTISPDPFSISSGDYFSARLVEDNITAYEVLDIRVVPLENVPAFTVEGTVPFTQTGLSRLTPRRIRIHSDNVLTIKWKRGVSRKAKILGISSGKLIITIRPPRSVGNADLEVVFSPITVYID